MRSKIMNETTKKCPVCAEEIKLEAVKCRFCGARFEVTNAGYCQNCHQVREASENGQCKICGNTILDLHLQSRHIVEGPAARTAAPVPPKPKSSRLFFGGILIGLMGIGVVLCGLLLIGIKVFQSGNLPVPQAVNTLIAPVIPTDQPTTISEADGIPESPAQATVAPAEKGTGIATGRILWDGKPLAGATVTLCTDWGMFGGCKTQAYSAVTGADGRYTISGLPAGEYDFSTKIPGQKNETGWFGMSVTVADGQTVSVRDANVIKYDLKITSPNDNETVKSKTPTLTWQAYPGAAYYKVYVADAVMFEQVMTNQYTFSNPLTANKYYWKIEAYNSDGTQIAESDGRYFVVAP
jgi:hypothetical protein